MVRPNYVKREHGDDITGLILACMDNNYDQVVYQVEKLKSNINYQATDGKTALMYAIYKNNFKIAEYLCNNGADKNIIDDKGNVALNYAITMAPNIATYLIINGANINIKNICDEYPIHFASMQGDLVVIQMLFERGAELNKFNYNKHTPLMMACGNKHFKCVKYLVKNGADINATDYNNDNILHGCIHNNIYDILLFLLTNKNNKVINDRNNDNESPLMYAIKEDKIEYVKILLKYGANTYTWDNKGYTPLLYTTEKDNYLMTELLLKSGADPNLYFTWMSYRSPLYNAVKNDSPELMQLLFRYNANDLLYIYIENNNINMFNYLLRKENINTKNSNGATPLFFAVERNNINIAKLLLEKGADPNICNHKDRNESPLYQAIMNKNYKMIKLLIKYKADYNHRLTINGFAGPILGESIMGRADRICWASEICDYLKSLNAKLFYEWD